MTIVYLSTCLFTSIVHIMINSLYYINNLYYQVKQLLVYIMIIVYIMTGLRHCFA